MKYFTTLILSLSFQFANAQYIGVRTTCEFSDHNALNTSFGVGGYLNFDSIINKTEFLFSFDLVSNKKYYASNELTTQEAFTIFTSSKNFSSTFLFLLPCNKNFVIKLGPSVSYRATNVFDDGGYLNWGDAYNLYYIGAAFTINAQFQNVFKIPMDFDLFISPSYFFQIKKNSPGGYSKDHFIGSLWVLDQQFGIAYNF